MHSLEKRQEKLIHETVVSGIQETMVIGIQERLEQSCNKNQIKLFCQIGSPTRIKTAWKPFLGMSAPQNLRTCFEMIHGGSAEPLVTTHRDDPSKLAHSHVGGLTRVDADSGAQ